VAFVTIAGFCFWKATPGLLSDQPLVADVQLVSLAKSDGKRRSKSTPIQDLRVGMRVVGRNPLSEDAQRDLPQPEPATWRLVRAQIEMQPGKFCHVELLRPLTWIAEAAQEANDELRSLPLMKCATGFATAEMCATGSASEKMCGTGSAQ
jgi:hypothetical protein